jgi:hypothetical protein
VAIITDDAQSANTMADLVISFITLLLLAAKGCCDREVNMIRPPLIARQRGWRGLTSPAIPNAMTRRIAADPNRLFREEESDGPDTVGWIRKSAVGGLPATCVVDYLPEMLNQSWS